MSLQGGSDGQLLYTKGFTPAWDIRYDAFNTSDVAVFDLKTINTSCAGYSDVVSDENFVYLCPTLDSSQFVSYIINASINDLDSYQNMLLTSIDSHLTSLSAIVYDNHRYIYFIPSDSTNAYACRYDTSYKDITNVSAYVVFNVGTVGIGCTAFGSGIFDGRYVYFLPNGINNVGLQYDTRLPFDNTNSYATFDFSDIMDTVGFSGSAYDGTYIYMSPYNDISQHGTIVIYNVTSDFTNENSYQVFDLTTLNSVAVGFRKCCVNDKYIHFVSATNSLTVVLDTTKNVESSDAYTLFDMQRVNVNFTMATSCVCIDKYIYYCFPGTYIARYNTLKTSIDTAWDYVDLSVFSVNCCGFVSMFCDGFHIYCAPYKLADGVTPSGLLTRIFIGNDTSIRKLNDVSVTQQCTGDIIAFNSNLKLQNVTGLSQKGDLLTYDGTNYSTLPVVTNGMILKIDTTTSSYVSWSSSTSNVVVTPQSTIDNPIVGDIWFDITNNALTTQTVTGALSDPLLYKNIVDVTQGTILNLNHLCKTITCSFSSPLTITVPTNTTTPFPIGAEVELMLTGSGSVQIVPADGTVVINSIGGHLFISTEYTTAVLKKIAINTWFAYGNLTAV